jgi:hypothetical protein
MDTLAHRCRPEDFYKLSIVQYTLKRLGAFLERFDSLVAEYSHSRKVITHLFRWVKSFVKIKLYYEIIKEMLLHDEDPEAFCFDRLADRLPFEPAEVRRIHPERLNFDHFRAVDKFLNLFIFEEMDILTCEKNRHLFACWDVIRNDARFVVS